MQDFFHFGGGGFSKNKTVFGGPDPVQSCWTFRILSPVELWPCLTSSHLGHIGCFIERDAAWLLDSAQKHQRGVWLVSWENSDWSHWLVGWHTRCILSRFRLFPRELQALNGNWKRCGSKTNLSLMHLLVHCEQSNCYAAFGSGCFSNETNKLRRPPVLSGAFRLLGF